MSTNMDLGGDKEALVQSMLRRGQFTRGKWYCDCGQAARCLTTKSGPNKGRRCALSAFYYPTRAKANLSIQSGGVTKSTMNKSAHFFSG